MSRISSSISVTRTNMTFDAGHRLLAHDGKCANLHGHGYKLGITCEAEQLDDVGRVVDFSVIKSIVGSWVDDNLDHTMILNAEDPALKYWNAIQEETIAVLRAKGVLRSPEFYRSVYIVDFEPTSENILEHICQSASLLLNAWHMQQPPGTPKVTVKRGVLWETRNCYATWQLQR